MNNRIIKIFLSIIILVLVSIFYFASQSQAEENANEVRPALVQERRVQLEKELESLEAQINAYQNTIVQKQREATSLERDIAILDAKIDKAKLEIRARNITINNLTDGIKERSEKIDQLGLKIERMNESLAELLRKVNEMDSASLIEIILGYNNFSDFLIESESIDTIQDAIQKSYEQIRGIKDLTEKERAALHDRKNEEIELRGLQELEKKRIEEAEFEKKRILTKTKGQEKEYQKIIAARKKDAASIRSELFLLTGSPAIPFEKAVEYANIAGRATGVRPSFLLGVIAEESELGANLGSGNWKTDLYECYIRIGYKKSAENQKEAFLEITEELGLNPDLLPVSKAPYYGCGGAMGPAQFMPTTWQLYKNKVGEITGNKPANPWNPLDAFIASALLLKDNGASEGTYQAEWRAALRYLAGSNWNKPAYRFYGDDVMALAAKYEEQMNILKNLARN